LPSLLTLSFVGCPGVTQISSALTRLVALNCAGTAVAVIPDTLVELGWIVCGGCPNIAVIPRTLVALHTLHCCDCPNLVSIPMTPTLTHMECAGCSSLRGPAPPNLVQGENSRCPIQFVRFVGQHRKLVRLAKWIRNHKARSLARRLGTDAHISWYYTLAGPGGQRAVARLAAGNTGHVPGRKRSEGRTRGHTQSGSLSPRSLDDD